jgi:hypothetical protein
MSTDNFSTVELLFVFLIIIAIEVVARVYGWKRWFTAPLTVFLGACFILVALSTGPVK